MVNQEILGGLKLAIKRGVSLQKAMTTFYNAGYKKEEIEEAARALQQEKTKTSIAPLKKAKESKKTKSLPETPKLPKTPKKVSDYGKPKKKPKRRIWKWFLIGFIAIVLLFVALLIAFLFSS